jgi:hypothetical protein
MFTEIRTQEQRVQDILAYNPALRANASILNTKRHPELTTEKYAESDDLGIIEVFNRQGWFIKDYQEVAVRKTGLSGFQKYMATYENPNLPALKDARARIIQTGSHDGTAKWKLHAGLFVFACTNGLIVGDDLFPPVEFKHLHGDFNDVVPVIHQVADKFPEVYGRIEGMQNRTMSEIEMTQFGKEATALRYDGDKYKVEVADVLRPRRIADDGNNLWQVFNRCQENLVNPNETLKIQGTTGKTRKARSLTNISAKVDFNTQLWNLAEQYLAG